MFTEHYVYFIDSKKYVGPFMTFEAAFSHIARHQKDARIELADDTILATWSLWTGLFKVGVKYKYKILDNPFNRQHYADLVGKLLDQAPNGVMVQEVEAA